MKNTVISALIAIGIFLIAYAIHSKKIECAEYPPICCSKDRALHLEEDKAEVDLFLASTLSFNIDDTLSYQPLFINMEKGKSFTLFARVSGTIGTGKRKRVNKLKFALGNGDGSYSTISSVEQPIRIDANTINLPFLFTHHQCGTPYIPKVVDYTITEAKNFIKHGDLILDPSHFDERGHLNFKSYQVGDHVCGARAHQPSAR
jgi:hypothetical protein